VNEFTCRGDLIDPKKYQRKFAAAVFNPAQMCGAQNQIVGAQSQASIRWFG
jgi:hypothetical protein